MSFVYGGLPYFRVINLQILMSVEKTQTDVPRYATTMLDPTPVAATLATVSM